MDGDWRGAHPAVAPEFGRRRSCRVALNARYEGWVENDDAIFAALLTAEPHLWPRIRRLEIIRADGSAIACSLDGLLVLGGDVTAPTLNIFRVADGGPARRKFLERHGVPATHIGEGRARLRLRRGGGARRSVHAEMTPIKSLTTSAGGRSSTCSAAPWRRARRELRWKTRAPRRSSACRWSRARRRSRATSTRRRSSARRRSSTAGFRRGDRRARRRFRRL